MRYDAVVIGAGHNGLTCAAYLGRAGLKVLVLERREVVGGAAATEEIFPGFHFDTCAHLINGIHPSVASDLDLKQHGFQLIQPESCVYAPNLDGAPLTLWRDQSRTVDEIRKFSTNDANAWPAFVALVGSVARFVALMYGQLPINAPKPELSDAGSLIKFARHFKRLDPSQRAALMHTLPASVAELLDDRFETDLLKGVVAAAGTLGIFQGPLAAGTAYTLFHNHAYASPGVIRPSGSVSGGIGSLAGSLMKSAKSHGVSLRTAAHVAVITVRDGRAVGVVLESGEEIQARYVISNADPRRTLLHILDTSTLATDIVRQVKNVKFRGALAKVNLALGELPAFTATAEQHRLMGAVSVAPSIEYLERAFDAAKYGAPSKQLAMEITIPTLNNPSMAPNGKHVLSATIQYVPYALKDSSWTKAESDRLGERTVETITQYAPNVASSLIHRQVITPFDLEHDYGLTEGNANHGELTLDQLYFMRPIPGWSRYKSPVESLYLCGAGTHAGGGVTCAAGFNAAQVVKKDAKVR